jgi:Uma2 family endonuclease
MAAPLRADPDDGFTVEEAERLLPEHARFELHKGRIVVMSPAKQWHSRAQVRIMNLLQQQGRIAGIEVGLRVAAKESRVLDVAVFRREIDPDSAYFEPADIEVAVEVVSPSSRDDDYVDKPKLYAQLGIPEFWRVDQDANGVIHVCRHRLDGADGSYVLYDDATLDALEAETGR